MSTIGDRLSSFNKALPPGVKLIAVSKTHPPDLVKSAYDAGQRDFGENRVKELISKAKALPSDIRWHLIGHLQTNKVKSVIPFTSLIHSVDSIKLLAEINRQAGLAGKQTEILLQVHIAQEEHKYGFLPEEILGVCENMKEVYPHVTPRGFMGMATNTRDEWVVRNEFRKLKKLFDEARKLLPNLQELSMGMSGDYQIAIEEGATMIRVGSLIFGERPSHGG